MKIQLPQIKEEKKLKVPHFPTAYQCVIFRNWGLVPEERIAKVVQTDIGTLRECATLMGLPENPEVSEEWVKKGYITIIHYNWHILSYEDICVLLDWTLDKLAFTLREDDFLEVKLGGFKPAVSDYRYRPLDITELKETLVIGKIVKETLKKLPPVTVKPFDFTPYFRIHGGAPMVLSNPRYEERYVYSYCALYGDTLSDKSLMDQSFPDELLEAYAALGITGVWIHIVLYTIVPFPFDARLSEGWKARQEGMRYLTEKLKKYGLRLFLYFNEPRSLPDAFFQEYPELKGMTRESYSTLCVSRSEVQAYLRDSVAMLVKNIPLLGGFFTITASENMTNCYSHVPYGKKSPCPHCSDMSRADSFALVNRLVWEGVSSVSDSVRVIAWTWGWKPEEVQSVIERLPREIAVMNVSEQGICKEIGGTETNVLDYSISVEGPGEYAIGNWRYAHQTGHKAYAKLQVNNSWEFAAVPYLPVFEKIYRHMCKLTAVRGTSLNGLMLSWSLGGYPSTTMQLLAAFYEKEDDVPALSKIYETMFKGVDVSVLTKAFHQFSEAFDLYPFHIGTVYFGPQEHSPANLLYEHASGFKASMTGFPYDDMDGWRNIFSIETYMHQLKTMSDQWHAGVEILRSVCQESEEPILQELWDCAQVCDCHFRSMYLQCQFICLRDGISTKDTLSVEEILQEEEEISFCIAAIQAHNPTIGYESSNHYFYNRNALLEKIINCRHLASHISPPFCNNFRSF